MGCSCQHPFSLLLIFWDQTSFLEFGHDTTSMLESFGIDVYVLVQRPRTHKSRSNGQ